MPAKAYTEEDPNKWIGSKAQLLKLLDTSATNFTNYEAKGLIVRTAAREYDLLATNKKVLAYLRAIAGKQNPSSDLKEQKTAEEIRELRLSNAKAEGELVPIAEVHKVVRKALVATADWLESLPDSFESRGIIAPAMAAEFIRVLDNQREVLLNMVLASVDDVEDTPEP